MITLALLAFTIGGPAFDVAQAREATAYAEVAQEQAAVRVPRAVLERYVGEWIYPDGNSFTVGLEGDTLFQELPGRRLAYAPLSETLFMLGPLFTAEFVIDPAGGAMQILSNGTSLEFRLRRKGSPLAQPAASSTLTAPAVRVPRSVLERYAGTYEFVAGQMKRTDLRIVIRLEGDTLLRDGVGSNGVVLTPLSETRFRVGNTSFVVEFVVDEAGVTQVLGTGFQQMLARLTSKTAQTSAVSPAEQRLRELVAAVNTGDAAAMRAYLVENSLNERMQSWDSNLLPMMLELHRLSRGLEVVRVTTLGAQQIQPQLMGRTVGILLNKTTGDEQALAIGVEPQAPHRITGLPILHPSLIATLVRPAPPVARTEQAQLQEIGAYLKRLADADIFSGVVIISRDGQPVFSQAHGYADRGKTIPNTLSTPFLLGSMNKLFTGLAIGQLVERGKLSYDDPLSRFLPDYPDRESAKRIKIKHLLSHTSGLLPGFTGKAYYDSLDRLSTVQALVDVSERKPPQFEPGTRHAYSNMGFVLLGRVIEIVSGEDYYGYMQRNVFAPAGMTSTSFPMLPRNGEAAVPMAYPYEVEFGGERQRHVNKLGVDFRRGGPSCCAVASALDLIALDNALAGGRVVKPETFRIHSSPKPELGAPNYGYGFAVGARMAKRPLVGHGGNAYGQCTEFGDLTDTPYTLVVLSNLTIGTCFSVTGKILQVLAPTPRGPERSEGAERPETLRGGGPPRN